ncbi:hypothetical protein [Porphyromonas sp.]|uniref:hypothetical protein n=1 Tax=Porphyromonas sp. TaxID=1924944 RepID=UPI0026DB4656|nr:hypothetical protein [Porphyromonas sp.]MDO4771512.1 hypothetical protein [Porphyromonas sp.]
MRHLAVILAIFMIIPLIEARGQKSKTQDPIKISISLKGDLTASHEEWAKTSDSTFVYEMAEGLTVYFRTEKIKKEPSLHENLNVIRLEKLVALKDFSELVTYKDVHKKFPTLLLEIENRKKEAGNLYKVTDRSIRRTKKPHPPVYILVNTPPIKREAYTEQWKLEKEASGEEYGFVFEMNIPKEDRETIIFNFDRRPHSTITISKEQYEGYKLTHPHELWKVIRTKCNKFNIRASYYYPEIYLIERRDDKFYLSDVEDWDILCFPPIPPEATKHICPLFETDSIQ